MTRHEAHDTLQATLTAAGYQPESHRALKRMAERIIELSEPPARKVYYSRHPEQLTPFQCLFREMVEGKDEAIKQALRVLARGPSFASIISAEDEV